MGTQVRVVIATYRRPDRLREAVLSLARAAERGPDGIALGVVVVDDDPEGSARIVAEGCDRLFALGCSYVPCGSRNISHARNAGLDAALPGSDWVGSIDDDVVVPETWVATFAHAAAQGWDGATGPLMKDFSQGPAWLTREPFDQFGLMTGTEGEAAAVCATGNNWIAADFLRERPALRFDPDLGTVGGEDMDFFRRAVGSGLAAMYSRQAAVTEREPPARCTLRYQLRRAFWLGLSEAQIGLRHDQTSRFRLVARAARRAADRGARRIDPVRLQDRGVRFTTTIYAECLGVLLGAFGFRLRHK